VSKQQTKTTRWIPSREKEIERLVAKLYREWDPASFAGRLKLIRAHEGLSVHQAAQLADLDNGSWHNWEKGGQVRGHEEVARKIVTAFGCDGDWLLRGTEIPCFNQQPQLWPVAVKDAS
jgi:DNA-binding XRE family transcriptional regulator